MEVTFSFCSPSCDETSVLDGKKKVHFRDEQRFWIKTLLPIREVPLINTLPPISRHLILSFRFSLDCQELGLLRLLMDKDE